MGKDLFVLGTVWFLIIAVFIVGVFLALSYSTEHFESCWNCGESIDKECSFCTSCGATMSPVCPGCGAECDTAYCGDCGALMGSED